MKINKHNLEIAKHCAKEAFKDYALDLLHFTDKGTFVACQWFSIAVTALAVYSQDRPASMTPSEARSFADYAGDGELELETILLPQLPGKFPDISRYDGKTPVFRIDLNAEYLLQLAQATVDFGGESARIEFTAPDEPTRWFSTNAKTGQQFEALLMPRKSR